MNPRRTTGSLLEVAAGLVLAAAIGVGLAACGQDDDSGDTGAPSDSDQSADEATISVEELLDTRPQGEVSVRAVVFDGGDGLVLCAALAESFPPQCPGDAVPIDQADEADLDLRTADGVRWTDRAIVAVGTLIEDRFQVRSITTGAG